MKKAVKQSRWTSFKRTLYNPQKNEICGRTFREWVLIFIFYVLAYCFLAGFFIGMLFVFLYAYVDSGVPTLTGEHSILRFRPGIGLAAKPNAYDTFIQVATYQSTINDPYINKVNELFSKYTSTNENENCDTPGLHPNNPNIPCIFDLSVLGECRNIVTSLMEGKPCVLVKVNRIFGWLPHLENPSEIPSPGIECGGTNEFDRESLGVIRYFPEHTGLDMKKYGLFSNNYFPFVGIKNYQDPLVAVQFLNITKNHVVLVECHLVGIKNGGGGASFEISVDDRVLGK
uniref:ATPase, P-type cation exchange, beta subunit,domain-containing protein n=1 Tax=Schistosoma japonicum TaxID=6182 RepID=C1LER2_SCHJA|nr:ATPase, P-type cation exchange, beta subunit,domain-containing protein [Schistosoma japonicum]